MYLTQMHLRLSSMQQNGRNFHEANNEIMKLFKGESTINFDQHLKNYQSYHHQQTGTWTKRFILWSILLVQFGFILYFWLMQLGLSDKLNESSGTNHELDENKKIHFVQSKDLTSKKLNPGEHKLPAVTNFQWPSRDFKFQNDFMLHQSNFNLSETENIIFGKTTLWCFREGTINYTRIRNIEWDDFNPWQEECECSPEWHGRDCGQPEVIWRALLTSKIPFKLKDPAREEAHRLVYMLEGNFLNLDLMELQVKSVSKVVDYFIVYLKRKSMNFKDLKATKFRLKQILPLKNYFIYHCKLSSYINCSSAEAYRLFRQQHLPNNAIKPTDIFVFTDDKTILSHRALNFLKYYSSDVPPVIQFRLKFNVFGFYWQHPNQTHLSGLISSFQNVDNSDANPSLLQTQITIRHQHKSLVIGDLNHYGGWFCKYCQQADEIINELQLSESSCNAHITLLPSKPPQSIQRAVVCPLDIRRSSSIDVAYVHQLISQGIYLTNGNTQLQKVRRYTDKYYAPHYASEQSWKYGHLLINIYESLADSLASDNEDEMF